MASSKSASSTSSQTSSTQEDNRVSGDNGAVVLGKDAGIVVNQQFGNNVLTAFQDLVGLAKDAGSLVLTTTKAAQDNSQAALGTVTTALQDTRQGTTTTESAFMKYLPLMIGAAVVIFIFMLIFRKKG